MAENNFDSTVASLFKGMDAFISAKTVVGDAVTVKDTIILPLVDVSFGVGAGAFAGDKKNNAGGGMTGKVTPSAVLVIQNGATKLVNIKNQDTVTKILDMIPDVIDKFKGKDEKVVTDADIDATIEDAKRVVFHKHMLCAYYITYLLRKCIYVQTAWIYILLDCCWHDNNTVYNG